MFGARINDPKLPDGLRDAAALGQRATDVQETGGEPIVWASVPMADDKILSISSRFSEPTAILDNLDRALVIGCGRGGVRRVGAECADRRAAVAPAAQGGGRRPPGRRGRTGRPGAGRDRRRVRDETDELARAVDAMTDALQDRLEAERRVTADIAHELRTPVTGLLTAAELLPPGRPTELVRDRAQALRTLVEDVLEVARLDGASERADLQEVALPRVRPPPGARCWPRRRRSGCVRDAWVYTDPRRLERILGNLLANARTPRQRRRSR